MIGGFDVVTAKSLVPALATVTHAGSIAPGPSMSEDERWRAWQYQGRYDDARFRRKLRTVLIDGAGVAAVAGAVWFAVAPWL